MYTSPGFETILLLADYRIADAATLNQHRRVCTRGSRSSNTLNQLNVDKCLELGVVRDLLS